MKKRIFKVVCLVMLLALTLTTLIACGNGDGGNGGGNKGGGNTPPVTDTRPLLTLTSNIAAAGSVSGGGHFDYNDDLSIKATVNSGYYFLGWYHGTDLLSTSPEYNCKMWDKSVTLEAKYMAIPEGYTGSGSLGNATNQKYELCVKSTTPKLGTISVDDGGYAEKYTAEVKMGTTIKALSLTTGSQKFLGWFDESDNLVMANGVFDFVMPMFDFTLTAKWECDSHGNNAYDAATNKYGCVTCGSELEGVTVTEDGFILLESDDEIQLLKYTGSASSLTIPANVTSIAAEAFYENKNLSSVTFEENSQLKSIGDSAFYFCRNLSSITIPNTVSFVGYNAFEGCNLTENDYDNALYLGNNSNPYVVLLWVKDNYYITSCNIHQNTKVIYCNAFEDCYNLTSIAIPTSVTSIGDYAFRNSSLTSITIPASVTSLGSSAFSGCDNLVSITAEADNPKYHSTGNCLIETATKTLIAGCATSIIPTDGSVTSIGNSAFFGSSPTSITIPSSVTSIGDYAFQNSSLTSITIPASVTNLGRGAFSWCYGLESVTFGENSKLTTIGAAAFNNCAHLSSITIPASVTSLGRDAFGMSGLASAVFENTNGWYLDDEPLTGVDLKNSTTAAQTLRNWDYRNHTWTRK